MSTLKTNSVYINVGMPAKPREVSSFTLASGNKIVAGAGAGELPKTQEMLSFCAEHNIVCYIELIDIKDIHTAFDKMERGDVRYGFVIDIASL